MQSLFSISHKLQDEQIANALEFCCDAQNSSVTFELAAPIRDHQWRHFAS
jgi:hypothetical protein